MKTIEFEAQLDGGRTLVIPEDIAAALPVSGKATVLVVVDTEALEDERQVWLTASMDYLRLAYSDSEPDYSPKMLKERNPDYTG